MYFARLSDTPEKETDRSAVNAVCLFSFYSVLFYSVKNVRYPFYRLHYCLIM